MSPLDPNEENLLRRVEEQISADDPRLARRLGALRPPVLERLAPTRWQPRVFVAIGIVLVVLGVLLGVGSSILGGLLSLGLAWARARQDGRSSPSHESGGQHGTSFTHR